MSQSTLDDDELFGEAASEVRADVEAGLAAARAGLPEPDEIWALDADNTLGALNALRSALDTEGAAEDLREAKKWYALGERADAFEDADDLAAEIDELEDLLEAVAEARKAVGSLASTIPELRSELEAATEGADADVEADDGAEAGA
ncbi:MAG: DUF5790 family protein [Salinirussus sp.]